ncbi:uncharacterized protein LOC113030836 [Astatotilapia calliptera]|uniref:uncharacterized protein LOC113030836 n=1 Tax=Astatotilapia calliptera TaxID=8154 RepID=UPI000E423AAC|nr:uncharacterized protein LOC113006445 isoform X1 [Astatotilapia calliptera]XP_026024967.1 uncharacterized protein LOC113023090 isoform X1 [Astatotilapia calliptera]XP_026025465.1 uncharacterized protein LOC113023551 isoform X1 [Astatotilapia calliptera]XP_026029478.1 uncharacterized protein LOC113025676 isoform X1 [Astatotilapia calliptera]XP_026029479.1 uncharacterized protein LOC113025676 isoform X2 [Astatotilapia calliptera]XP_026038356.1 uncharacterized protein LOC113030836 [Astatotilapi
MFALTCVCFPICISKRTARQPRGGGRGPLMTPQQEERICAMVAANNALRLREIQRTVVNDDTIFGNIQSISISTIDRVLRRNEMSMKQLYRVPFERNSDRVKELRHQYVQHILELEAREPLHMFVYLDEAGFNLAKGRRRGRNHIGERATIDVPGQRGGNITMCAAISENGVHTHIPRIGAYNSQHLLAFLDALHRDLIPQNGRDDPGDNRTMYVVVWDNVSFHHSAVVRQWFAAHDRMLMEFLPPYSPFLNPIEEFFSSWRWKVYDRHPHTQMTLLAAMDAACDDITAESCRGWIRHSRRYFPRCIDRADIRCDVDANMWADRRERLDIND